MAFVDRLRGVVAPGGGWANLGERTDAGLSLAQWQNQLSQTVLNFGGQAYGPQGVGLSTTMQGHHEEMDTTFIGLVNQAYKRHGVVFSCMLVRQMLFAQATFMFRQWHNGYPGNLFSTSGLDLLRHPWPGGTTSDLLGRMLQHADLGGNAFVVQRPATPAAPFGRLRVARPDWVTLVVGSQDAPSSELGDLDAEVLGLIYHPGGPYSGRRPVPVLAADFAHFAPLPDPMASFRGMSWLMPIIRNAQSHAAATTHKLQFFENAATPNMVVTIDATVRKEAFEEWVALFDKKHAGLGEAYRTIYLGAGATAHVVGSNLQQMDFKTIQGADETLIAAAAGTPPIIVGLSEGLASGTYSNYGQAMRRFGDITLAWLWQNAAGSLQQIITPPNAAAELWYDKQGISALRVDNKDAADIQFIKAQTIRQLIDGGFTSDSVIKAVESEDYTLLEHTGLFSVQLQAPGSAKMPAGEVPPEIPVAPTAPDAVKLGAGDVTMGKPPGAATPTAPAAAPATPPGAGKPLPGKNGKTPAAAKAGRALEQLLSTRRDNDAR